MGKKMEEFYKLIGTVTIPEDKKEELNDNILKLLDRCGLRKIKTVTVAGSKIEVSCRVAPNAKGIVAFDYSIFEKKHRKKSYYNVNTCELKINDCGFSEFGVAMMMALTMLESYSSTPCYMVKNDEINGVNSCALLIENILGIRLRFPNRADIWGTYLFWRKNPDIHGTDIREIWQKVPWDFEKTNFNMMLDIIAVKDDTVLSKNFEIATFDKEQIAVAEHVERIKYLYNAYRELSDNNMNPEDCLRSIIRKSLKERDEVSRGDSRLAVVAELSKYLTAATIIHVYALTVHEDFEETWDRIAGNGYYKDVISDEDADDKKKDGKRPQIFFYEIIRRESEDEFLGENSNRELTISPDMKDELKRWKSMMDKISVSSYTDVAEELQDILNELNTEWKVRRPDISLIKEITNKKNYKSAIKILSLLRAVLDDGVEFFPELTKAQAKEWILKRTRCDFDRQKLDGLLGLLANKEKVMEILGF